VLNAVQFVDDTHLASLLQGMAGESKEFAIEAHTETARTGYAIARALSTHRPDVVLVEMTNLERDLPIVAAIHNHSPELPIVGIGASDVQYQLKGNADLSSVALWPFTVAELEGAISEAVHKLHGGICENLVAFLPGKAGSGTSTIVLNSARVLTRELNRKVLVMDSDLHSGLIAAMLNVEPTFSIREALAEAPHIDSMSWQRFVTTVGGVDFLLTNPAKKEPVPHWTHYFQLFRFAAKKYELMMVDLPEVVNPATAEVVRRAHAVYVVSTPEFASLKLSKQRCQELENWGVGRERIHVLLNREHSSDLGQKDAERILGYPVAATFPNDYKTVQKAVKEAGFIDTRSHLGGAYAVFSKILAGVEVEKKSFMGMFRR
jgi:MinD-like ATPase involved in chromosome partitioning or flagellar assembly